MPSSLFDNPAQKINAAPRSLSLPELVSKFDEFSKTVTPEEAEKRVKALVAEGVIGKQKFAELRSLAGSLLGVLGKNRR